MWYRLCVINRLPGHPIRPTPRLYLQRRLHLHFPKLMKLIKDTRAVSQASGSQYRRVGRRRRGCSDRPRLRRHLLTSPVTIQKLSRCVTILHPDCWNQIG